MSKRRKASTTDQNQGNATKGNGGKGETTDKSRKNPSKITEGDGKGEESGNVSAAPCPADALPDGLPPARARDGETRNQTWERLRREARAAGMTRKAAISYATAGADQFHPHFAQLDPQPAPEPDPEPEPVGLTGLGDLPADWPELPPNAALPAEVQWVQSNRIRCVQGMEVDLSRALAPAPSHAALAWLETACLFPSKWADVALKGTQHAQDEAQHVRDERKTIEELRTILAEMAPTCPHCGELLG